MEECRREFILDVPDVLMGFCSPSGMLRPEFLTIAGIGKHFAVIATGSRTKVSR